MKSGESFELEVKEHLEYELTQETLGIQGKSAEIFLHKPYYSESRKSKIITDVSVEVYRKEAKEPFLIWVWECKEYKHSVPVDDIEEFHAKLEQIGLHKTKGTVICRNGFQKSAIQYAKAKGIGLARLLPKGSIIRLLEAIRTLPDQAIEMGLTEDDTQNLESMFYGFSSTGKGFMVFSDFILVESQRIK